MSGLTDDELLQIAARAKFLADSYKHHRDGAGLAAKEISRDSVPRLLDEVQRLRERLLNGPTEPGDLAERIRETLKAERDTLRAEAEKLRADVIAADERMAAVLDGTFAVGDGTAQREIERLHAEIARMRPVFVAAMALGQAACEKYDECPAIDGHDVRCALGEKREQLRLVTNAAHADAAARVRRAVEAKEPR